MRALLSYLGRHHVGLLALFLALGGTSYAVAAGSIDSREIRDSTVRSRDVRNNTLVGRDIRNGAIGSQDVRDGRLTGADVAAGGLTGVDLRDGSVGDADLGSGSVSGDELRAGAVESDEVRNGSLREEDLGPGLRGSDAAVRFRSFSVAPGAAGSEDVGCASGDRALGGGVSFAAAHADDRVTFSAPRAGSSAPSSQGATATGWAAGIVNGDTAERSATVWALCASR